MSKVKSIGKFPVIVGLCMVLLMGGIPQPNDFYHWNSLAFSSGEDSLLTVGMQGSTGNFNPFYYPSGSDGDVVDLIFQRLVRRDLEGDWIGDAAEKWEITEDGKVITFTLKEGLLFSDGEPVTAEDVVFTYRVISDPSYAGGHTNYGQNLKGYEEYREGKTTDFPGVEAIDENTLRFTYRQEDGNNLENAGFYIVPKHHYQDYYQYNDTSRLLEKSADPLGSGPYILRNYIMEENVYLVRNESYYDTSTYKIQEIIMRLIEENTEMDDLRLGNIDLINRQREIRNIKIATEEEEIHYNKYYSNTQGLYLFNHEYGATKDLAVRKALRHAMALEELMEHHFMGFGKVPAHPYGENAWLNEDRDIQSLSNPEFNLAKANEILEEGGWLLNEEGYREKEGEVLALRILGSTHSEVIESLSPLWDRDWGNALGIKIDTAYGGMDSIIKDLVYEADENVELWNVVFMEVPTNTFEPLQTVAGFFHSDNIGSNRGNISRYQNDILDEKIESSHSLGRTGEGKENYYNIANLLQEDHVYAPIYTPEYYDLYTEDLKNFETNNHFNWTRALETATLNRVESDKSDRDNGDEGGFPWTMAGVGVIGIFVFIKRKTN